MTPEQEKVKEFHKAFDILVATKPKLPTFAVRNLRMKLINEEAKELHDALEKGNLIETADALADLIYVVYGAAVSFGIDLEPIFNEVHKTNMAKVGGYKREDGKWMKPEGWQPPQLKPIIASQMR